MSNISVRWTMKLKRQRKSHSQTQLNHQISALLQERNPITLFCWFKYARYLDGGRLSLNVSCSQKLQRASSARLGLEMRQHVCGARTKWEFSTWVKGDLRPSQSTVHKKTCSHPQHRFAVNQIIKVKTKSVHLSRQSSFSKNVYTHVLHYLIL